MLAPLLFLASLAWGFVRDKDVHLTTVLPIGELNLKDASGLIAAVAAGSLALFVLLPSEIFQLCIMLNKRWRRPDPLPLQNGGELKRIHRSLSRIVIVAHEVGVFRLARHLTHAIDPRFQSWTAYE
jgi:hypothetical protein